MLALTGATGFLGRRVARRLAASGERVRCLVRGSSDLDPLRSYVGEGLWPSLEVVRANLLDAADCGASMDGCDRLLHVAAGLSGATSTLVLNSVSTTKAVLRAAADLDMRRAVVVSSLGIYDNSAVGRGDALTEETPLDPDPPARDPYTYTKLMQEREARAIAADRGLPLVVVRPGVIIGPGRGVVGGRCGLNVGPLLVQMGGRQTVPLTYVDNCADALVRAATAEGVEGETFNVLDDDLPSASRLVRMARRNGQRVRRVWLPGPLVGTACSAYHLYSRISGGQLPPILTRYRARAMWRPVRYDNSAAKRGLDWRPEVPIGEAVRRCVTGEDPASATGAAA